MIPLVPASVELATIDLVDVVRITGSKSECKVAVRHRNMTRASGQVPVPVEAGNDDVLDEPVGTCSDNPPNAGSTTVPAMVLWGQQHGSHTMEQDPTPAAAREDSGRSTFRSAVFCMSVASRTLRSPAQHRHPESPYGRLSRMTRFDLVGALKRGDGHRRAPYP
ncbi:MAG: hypothetical protein M5U09_11855 [Gammaproteobacteria bacterium]|nr:hypothetical protein [Gammaproteobacteria bacterium]